MTIAEIAAKAGTDAGTVVRVLQAIREPSVDMLGAGLLEQHLEMRWRAVVDELLRTISS